MNRQKLIIMPQLHDYKGDIGKQWFVYFSFRDPASGKMKRFRIYDGFTGLSKPDRYIHAQKLIEDLRAKLKNGWNPFTGDERVVYDDNLEYRKVAIEYGRQRESIRDIRFWCSQFLDRKKSGIRPSTYTTYKSKLRYLTDFIESIGLNGSHPALFNKDHALAFNKYLSDKRQVGNRSINEYNTLMRQLWNMMIDEGMVKENAFAKIKRLRFKGNPPRIYNHTLINDLKQLMLTHDPQMLVVVRLIFSCLIRPGELRKLRIKHIDFVRSQIRVPADIAKMGKQRIVDVPDYLLQELMAKDYHKAPASFFIIGRTGRPGVQMVGRNFMYNRFRSIRKRAGLTNDYWLYAFKHTGMVEMKLNGVDVLDIRNQAGHHSLDQTVDYLQELIGVGSEKIRRGVVRI